MPVGRHSFDLDAVRTRTGIKWTRFDRDVIPMWIADMDFPVAEEIVDAVESYVAAGDLGYTHPREAEELVSTAATWFGARHRLTIETATARVTRDVMQGVAASMLAFTDPADGIIVHTPIYPPFRQTVAAGDRRFLSCPLGEDGAVDLALMERLAASARAVLLCNPHNPRGRVLTENELAGVVDIARRFDLTIISDEIHCDLVYPEHRHIPISRIAPERTVTIVAASKTFNIAGLGCGIVAFGTSELAKQFATVPMNLIGHPRAINVRAATAAWRYGATWLGQTMRVLEHNRDRVAAWASDRRVLTTGPEATFLAWLDFRERDWPMEPSDHLRKTARVALSPGLEFGDTPGFARLNFATSPEILDEALSRIDATLS